MELQFSKAFNQPISNRNQSQIMHKLARLLLASALLLPTATVVSACDLNVSLANQGKALSRTIGIPKSEFEYYENLGVTLKKGLFGTYYVETSELVDKLASHEECPETVVTRVSRRAKPLTAETKPSGMTDEEYARMLLENGITFEPDPFLCVVGGLEAYCPESNLATPYRNQVPEGPKNHFDAFWK